MNYYKQIAEMLGIELGEEFSLKGNYTGEINRPRYKITQEEGLMYSTGSKEWKRSIILLSIIDGAYSIVKLPWKPKNGDSYYRWGKDGRRAYYESWYDRGLDLSYWKLGNCFKTREEAETKGKELMEAIKKEYEEA